MTAEINKVRDTKFRHYPKLYKNFDADEGLFEEKFDELKNLTLESQCAEIAKKVFSFENKSEENANTISEFKAKPCQTNTQSTANTFSVT